MAPALGLLGDLVLPDVALTPRVAEVPPRPDLLGPILGEVVGAADVGHGVVLLFQRPDGRPRDVAVGVQREEVDREPTRVDVVDGDCPFHRARVGEVAPLRRPDCVGLVVLIEAGLAVPAHEVLEHEHARAPARPLELEGSRGLPVRLPVDRADARRVAEPSVRNLAVPRVEVVVVQRLEDVAVLDVPAVAHDADPTVAEQLVVPREHGHQAGRTHVGEDESADFETRVRGVLDLVHERAAGRLARHLDHVAVAVVEPPVVHAPDAVALHRSVVERRLAVTTVLVQQVGVAFGIAEQDQVLAEHLDSDRVARSLVVVSGAPAEVRRHLDGEPVAPEHVAGRGAGAHHDVFELFLRTHGRTSLLALRPRSP